MRSSSRHFGLGLAVTAIAFGGACSADTPDSTATVASGSQPAESEAIVKIADLTMPRAAHTATALPDGRVLIAGGCTADGCEETTSGTELYDPGSRSFEVGPQMTTPRAGHTATALPGGLVLIAGGYSGEGTAPLATTEIFDPTTGKFRSTAPLSVGRGGHSAVGLGDGRVLVVGGVDGESRPLDRADIYDPEAQRWSVTGRMTSPRSAAAAVALADGTVLVTGGQAVPDEVLDTAEVFDPSTGQWAETGELHDGRYKHAASQLDDGRVLVVGGSGPGDQADQLDSAEIYDPATGRFEETGGLEWPRFKIPDAVVAGPDGRIVVAGGSPTVEVFDAGSAAFTTLDGQLSEALSFSTATRLQDGSILVSGGYSPSIAVSADASLVELLR